MGTAAGMAIDDLHPDILIQILCRLDGDTLATVACVASRLRALAEETDLWRNICLSSWPSLHHPSLQDIILSFPNSHRSFFFDAHPLPSPSTAAPIPSPVGDDDVPGLPKFISAVDLHHKGELVLSEVIETESESPWFLGSPFRVDGLDRKGRPPSTTTATASRLASPEEVTLSWIVVDPSNHRAVSLSSRQPVSVDRHWHTGETHVRFATVLGDGAAAATVVVKCTTESTQLTEVALTIEGVDGLCLSGRESLVLLQGLLKGERKGKGAEAKQSYWEYERRKSERKDKLLRREGRIDLFFVLAGVFSSFGFAAWIWMALL